MCNYSCVLCSFKLDGDTYGWLEIDKVSGVIKTKGKLDRETLETLTVTVTAFETGEITDAQSQHETFLCCRLVVAQVLD